MNTGLPVATGGQWGPHKAGKKNSATKFNKLLKAKCVFVCEYKLLGAANTK